MINCSNCGAGLRFDPAMQKLRCTSCDSLFLVEEYGSRKSEGVHVAQEEQMSAQEAAAASLLNEEGYRNSGHYEVTLFTCPECGGEILSEDTTAATFCSFCGSSVLLEKRVTKEKSPEKIIPFQKTLEQSEKAYKRLLFRSVFAPRDMGTSETLEQMRGIYMPYWVYAYKHHEKEHFPGVKSYRRGDYLYSKHYDLTTEIDATYNGLSYDSSSSFADNLSQAIAPFSYEAAKPFHPGYLCGYYADTDDVAEEVYRKDACYLIASDEASRMLEDRRYEKYGATKESMARKLVPFEKKISSERVMYPVYFLSCRHKDRVSYAVVNGQTGKVAADVPIDFGKYIIGSLLLAIPIFFLLNLNFTFTPSALLGIIVVLSLLSWYVAGRQEDALYAREYYLEDRGVNAVKYRNRKITEEEKEQYAHRKEKVKILGLRIKDVLITLVLLAICRWLFALSPSFTTAAILAIVFYVLCPSWTLAEKRVVIKREYEITAPIERKVWIIARGGVSAGLAALVIFFNPVKDIYYYITAIICMLIIGWNFFELVKEHNLLTRRKLPQFEKRGGDM